MNINSENFVTLTEANENFSNLLEKVEKHNKIIRQFTNH